MMIYMPNNKLMMNSSALFKLKIKMQIFKNYNNKYKKIRSDFYNKLMTVALFKLMIKMQIFNNNNNKKIN